MTMASELLAAQKELLLMGGTFVDLYAADGTFKTTERGAFVNWNVEDEILRNDYDKEAQKFHFPPLALYVVPEKQDYIMFRSKRWTILDVHERIISGMTICYVCVVKK
jgi:hypothetical protein